MLSSVSSVGHIYISVVKFSPNVCVRACVRACVRVCVRACVRVHDDDDGGDEIILGIIALVAVAAW